MKRLEFMRRNLGLSQRDLGGKCAPKIAAADICKAERRGLVLYPGQTERLAKALGWNGDPMKLFEEVADDELAHA